MTIRHRRSLLALTLLAVTTPAWGETVLETVHLQASGFHDYNRDAVYPLSSTDTTFSFIYDTTAPETPATPLDYDLGFPAPFGQDLKYAVFQGSYISGSVQDELTVGQYVSPGSLTYLPDSIGLTVLIGIPSNSFYDRLFVTFADHQFYPDTLTFDFTQTPLSGVPEAPAWAMTIVGLGLVGAAMRRRRVVAPSAC